MRNAFPVVFALGVLTGLVWLLLGDPVRRTSGRWRDLDAAAFLRVDAGLAALAGGLLGARLAYVSSHWSYFGIHLDQVLALSKGGMNWAGGALGAILGLALFARLRRASVWSLADTLALPAALLAAVSWGGCLLDGCAYGRPLPVGLPALLSHDFFDSPIARWPTQLVGLLCCCALALGLLTLEPRISRPGLLACLTITTLGLLGMALSFARGDPVPLIGNLRLDFVGGAIVSAIGGAGCLSLRRRPPV